jgi:CTD kinase subunit gamma
MYFIEHFLEMANKDGHVSYVRMMQRDIIRVVDAVAPEDGSGVANFKVVRKVLQGLRQKNFLEAQTVAEIEDVLRERDTSSHDISMSSPVEGDHADLGDMPPSQTIPRAGRPGAPPPRPDKKQIEQRIEEDRERHKRLRESIWAIPAEPNAERDKLWEETSDLGDDDHLLGEEEFDEREKAIKQSCVHRQAESSSANGKGRH